MNNPERLMVGILGNAGSGKTYTWNTLFGHEVRTGKNLRRLYFNDSEYVRVFLVSRSPGKRKMPVGNILQGTHPPIVLCSLQYQHSLLDTLSYFRKNGYAMYLQWLNPGFEDEAEQPLFYDLGLITRILSECSYISVRNGKKDAAQRVAEIEDFLYGWAKRREIVQVRKPFSSIGAVDNS